MPYIKDKRNRSILNRIIDNYFILFKIKGHINYFLFKLAKETCVDYEDYRAFIGELEMCKQEIYRRQIAPYEDKKIEFSGDVE